jgi:hypothetical protein
MAVVAAEPDDVEGVNNIDSVRESARSIDVNRQYIQQARSVLRYRPDRVAAVIAGTVALHVAYEEAKQAKVEQETAAVRAEQARQRLARLQTGAPDLAEQVAGEALTLSEAWAAWTERTRQDREERGSVSAVYLYPTGPSPQEYR